jgi:hypothetical protein
MRGVILRNFSLEGSGAQRHNSGEDLSASRKMLRKLSMTPEWTQDFFKLSSTWRYGGISDPAGCDPDWRRPIL